MRIAAVCVFSLLFAAAMPSFAGSQQDKMKSCNADASAKNLKGDERKAFMKDCLSAKPAASAPMSQQDKMKVCNKDAGDKKLKGDERKAFMSNCLKK
ncbi:PsiF family protein [Andreprevotia chitinilytica]|uniref:PsiF family protein n=1 Tax=Andreprevotia chitinilytica TaxID=396808 RepID=UPI0005550CA8|nr:PsiF family protein [Andreprevotia chitinilytica]